MFEEILNSTLMLGAVATLLSGVIQGFTGFGGGLMVVPILAFLYSPLEAVAIVAIAATVGNIFILPDAIKNTYWPEAAPVSIGIAMAIPLGLTFLISADPDFIRRGMGVFILASAALLMTGWKFSGKRNVFTSLVTGGITGGITGSFGIPGAQFMYVYFLSAPVPPPTQRANIIVSGTIGMIFMIGGLIFEGIYNQQTTGLVIAIAPFFIIGVLAGKRIFKIAPAAWFKYVTYVILVVTGVFALAI